MNLSIEPLIIAHAASSPPLKRPRLWLLVSWSLLALQCNLQESANADWSTGFVHSKHRSLDRATSPSIPVVKFPINNLHFLKSSPKDIELASFIKGMQQAKP
jgi:hypothetical protein